MPIKEAVTLSKEDNPLLCKTGPGTPICELHRRYRALALIADEISEQDSPPGRVKINAYPTIVSGGLGLERESNRIALRVLATASLA